jgi:hypothetical protein
MGMNEQVYATRQIHGTHRKWLENDPVRKLQKVHAAGYVWDPETSKLKRPGPFGMTFATPWVHARGSHKYNCGFDHHIAFDLFGIISPTCLGCWKVCMGLPDFASLMEMADIQEQLPIDIPCKCGIETRDYTSKSYGAYFYTRSLDEGRDRYEVVKQTVLDNMTRGKEIAEGMVLKRGCTEFEMVKGPSPYWHITPKEMELYELMRAYVLDRGAVLSQHPMIQNYVKQTWIPWAHSRGDFSYLPWNDGKKLFPDYVSYHEGDINDIKRDLVLAQTQGTIPKDVKQPEPIDIEKVDYSEDVIGEEDELT